MNFTTNTDIVIRDVVARIDVRTVMCIGWAGVAIAACFFGFRIYVRTKTFSHLFADDALVLVAWLMLVASAITWQVNKDDVYTMLAVSAGALSTVPENFPTETEHLIRNATAVFVCFYSGIWSIKFSFLIFFRQLGSHFRSQKILWWSIFGITIATYFVSLGTIPYRCFNSSFLYIMENCTTPSSIAFQRQIILSNTVADVVTDALIITVPVNLLWKVQISLRRKLALAGIFSLTVFVMIFAIVRVVVISSYSPQPDATWLVTWNFVEQTVAIMIACLASYRALFTRTDSPNRPPGYKRKLPLRRPKESKVPIDHGNTGHQPYTIIHTGVDPLPEAFLLKLPFKSSQEDFALNQVHVRHDINVATSSV